MLKVNTSKAEWGFYWRGLPAAYLDRKGLGEVNPHTSFWPPTEKAPQPLEDRSKPNLWRYVKYTQAQTHKHILTYLHLGGHVNSNTTNEQDL